VNKRFAAVLKSNSKNVRYVLLEKTGPTFSQFSKVKNNFISIGAVLGGDAVGDDQLHRWVAERLTGLNDFVKYLHTKYLFVDPLGDNPTVISGSANFSDASTVNNDENMLVVQGDTTVADIYLGEFMRLWHHFFFRDIANRYARVNAAHDQPTVNGGANGGNGGNGNGLTAGSTPYLSETDAWADDYYGKNFRKTAERTLFA
jgi:phosphatidylserine/phosphatidylglycerophosphate/cardiolipin synthase-like enzyme